MIKRANTTRDRKMYLNSSNVNTKFEIECDLSLIAFILSEFIIIISA